MRQKAKASVWTLHTLWFDRQLDVFFNVETDLGEPAFEVSTVLLDDYLNSFKVMVCTRYVQFVACVRYGCVLGMGVVVWGLGAFVCVYVSVCVCVGGGG